MELLTTAIRNVKGIAKFIGAGDDPEIQMEIKAYTDIANGVKDMPTIEPERKTGQLDNDHIWNKLSKVYNMDSVPDEAKSIIGDVMLELGEQPDHTWHECFDDDPASFPDDERNVLVSFSNFSLSIIGQWRVDEDGAGCWYLGDTDETFLSEDLYVDGWWELPKKPERSN